MCINYNIIVRKGEKIMKFKTTLSSLILAVAVIVAQYLNYKIESKVSLTYNSTYEFVWCSIIMLVLGLIAGINICLLYTSDAADD